MKKTASYRLLSIDLDGTLLSPIIRTASKKDCTSIQEYLNANGTVVLNTGRPPYATLPTLNKINKSGPNNVKIISCLNGAYIKDFNDDSILESKIAHDYCKQFYDIIKHSKMKSVYMWFYMPRGIQDGIIESYPMPWWSKAYPIGHVRKISNLDDLSSYKISVISLNGKKLSKLYKQFINHGLDKFANITHSSKHLIEITNLNVNKGNALIILQNKYNISKNDTCSIGDTFNDESAFKASGVSIAVKPKSKLLAQQVTHIIKHKRNGVTKAINKYILKEQIQDVTETSTIK